MKTTQPANKFGLCIDWETTGSSWGKDSSVEHQGISFGAIVFDTSTFEEIECLDVFVKFKRDMYKWTTEAENIHRISIQFLEQHGIEQEEAAVLLAELILKYWGPGGKVMLLGHNAEFDRSFTNQLLNSIGIEFSYERKTKLDSWIEVHHVVLDTASAGYIAFGVYKSDLLFQKIGLAERGKHNAIEDARNTLLVCKTIRELINFSMKGIE